MYIYIISSSTLPFGHITLAIIASKLHGSEEPLLIAFVTVSSDLKKCVNAVEMSSQHAFIEKMTMNRYMNIAMSE